MVIGIIAKKKKKESGTTIFTDQSPMPLPKGYGNTADQIPNDVIIPEGANTAAEYIRDREKLAAMSGVSSKMAGYAMIGNQQALTEQALKERAAQKAQEEGIPLAKKQAEELAAIDSLKNNQKELSTYERNVQAGIAFTKSLGANIGMEVGETSPAMEGILSPLYAATGLIATTGIQGISLSTLFSPASGNIKNLQGDVSDNVAEAKRIATAATSSGSNVQQAIQSLTLLEESTRFKYQAAEKSLSESPKDVREGLDLADEMSRNLRTIVEYRQALERYTLTGDRDAVLFYIGT